MQSILVVEDSAEIHQLLRATLADGIIALHHAFSAAQGLELARLHRPDLILLDVSMPGTDGFEACALLKADPISALSLVIFLTAATSTSDKIRGLDLGAIDYITKPFDFAELKARVRSALRTKRFQDMLGERAQIDWLTGLRNRAYFHIRVGEELALFNRQERHFSLLMLDLDHFKSVNDHYGHPAGDHVLEMVGETLAKTVRAHDICCRYGGEEFALILPCTGLVAAETLAERLRVQVAGIAWNRKGLPSNVTTSVGVASTEQLRPPLADASGLVRLADEALYAAKRQGRNRTQRAVAFPSVGPILDLPDPELDLTCVKN